MTRKQQWLMAVATALPIALSACSMFDRMRGDGGNSGTSADGSNTGTSNDATVECRGLSGTALRDCLDRQGLNRGSTSK
ncbi:MAG TPA: hypothetical protein VFZ14_08020 [Burkholderiales bacterium]|nr:hypothetical protein [Burkholderiales bacterium]